MENRTTLRGMDCLEVVAVPPDRRDRDRGSGACARVPDITLRALGIILGAYLLVWGIFTLAAGFAPSGSVSLGVVRVLVGFVGIMAGLVCLVRPGASLLALLIAFSFWFILVGIGDIVEAMEATNNRGWMGLLGVVSIVAGVIILANPDIGLTTLALLVGIGLLVRGTLEIVVGFTLRGTRGATP